MDSSSRQNVSVPYYDVIVIGGSSIAGCATAFSTFDSQPATSILVLDDCGPTAFKVRVSWFAVAKQVLAGLCPRVLERTSEDNLRGGQCVREMYGNAPRWDSPSLEETYTITNPFGMGWHLDRAKFDQIIRESMIDVSQNRITLVKSSFEDVDIAEGGNWMARVD